VSRALLVGTSEVSITPPPDCQMIHRRATGILDLLYARTLAFELDGQRAAVVGLDLISLAREQAEGIKARANELCGVDGNAVMLCCSHTHSGPATNPFRGWGAGDPEYVGRMIELVAQGIAEAFGKLAPGRLAYGEWPLQIGHNRRLDDGSGWASMVRNPDGPVDKRVRGLRITDPETDTVRALLYSHGCHPVVLHVSNLHVSADYPGRAARLLKEQFGPEVCPVFGQGCGADANSEVLGGTVDDCERIGRLVGESAAEAVKRAEPIDCDSLRPMFQAVRLPTRLPTIEEAEKAVELNRADLEKFIASGPSDAAVEEYRECGVEWAEDLLRIARSPEEDHRLQMDVSALAFGRAFCIVGLGAEVFHRYHQICGSISPYPNTMVLSFVNGSVCYLPTADEFARNGYETAGQDYLDQIGYAYKRYGTLAFTPECENGVREAVKNLLGGT